jgi:hypothetical protein
MKKIAVCISGLMRYWKITSKLFEYWNTLFNDVEFYFFLSAWKDVSDIPLTTTDNLSKLVREENDFGKYKFLTKYKYLNYNDVSYESQPHKCGEINSKGQKIDNPGFKIPRLYTYALHQVSELRRSYEKENNLEFDGVIHTRNDILISKDVLITIRDLCCRRLVTPDVFFGMKEIKERPVYNLPKEWGKFSLLDTFGFAHPSVMYEYSKMYNDCYITGKNKAAGGNRQNAEQLILKNIKVLKLTRFIKKISLGNNCYVLVLRHDNTAQNGIPGFPTPEQLEYLITHRGMNFTLNMNRVQRKKYFCENWKDNIK